MKKCSKCKIEKDLSEFWKHKINKDGLRNICKECVRKYKKENNKHMKEYSKNWQKDNPEKCREYSIKYYENNPDKFREHRRKRRALKIEAEGSFTEKEFKKILQFYHYRCCACGTDLTKTDFHRDHIQPLSKGGSDFIKNIQPLCAYCNLSKHTKHRDHRDHWLQNYAI